MAKDVRFGEEARKEMLKGVNILANAVNTYRGSAPMFVNYGD